MGDVLPVRDSPLGGIVMVSAYHKCKRMLKRAVSILKMVRNPLAIDSRLGLDKATYENLIDPTRHPHHIPPDPLIMGNDWWWILFSSIPLFCTWACFCLFIVPDEVTHFIFLLSLAGFHLTVLYSILYWHREMSPFRLIGAKAKFMLEIIPMIVAATLRLLLKYYYLKYVLLLLSCTTYFYTFAHFMHAAYDIGLRDVYLGLAMVVLVLKLNEELLAGALILCLGVQVQVQVQPDVRESPLGGIVMLKRAVSILKMARNPLTVDSRIGLHKAMYENLIDPTSRHPHQSFNGVEEDIVLKKKCDGDEEEVGEDDNGGWGLRGWGRGGSGAANTIVPTAALLPTVDINHPYHLHAFDLPGMALVNNLFDGKGYQGWKRSVYIALSVKNKLGFITGSVVTPSSKSPDLPQ
ncbi:hypothetical protein FXO37_26699 [Capsicum annuum]|nr:hypothetical protein FXO37_26699 [Capsicum annuum]